MANVKRKVIVIYFEKLICTVKLTHFVLCNNIYESEMLIIVYVMISPRKGVHKLRSPPIFQGVGAGYWV